VIAIHAAGGDAQSMAAVTCPDGNAADPGCLIAVADRETFAVVSPSVTPGASTWNAGGGTNGYECVQGLACASNVDDVEYFHDLIQAVKRVINVDAGRVYATGYSNGAAMGHRLACELGDQLAAIAPVAGVNQFSAVATCAPARPVAVVEFHGTDDQVSPYDGGQGVYDTGIRLSVPATISGWAAAAQGTSGGRRSNQGRACSSWAPRRNSVASSP
jgi:polyhydroxybutyrate depolymerase